MQLYYIKLFIIKMNHVIEINKKNYLIRQESQKILLLTFPNLHMVSKFYINATHSYLNKQTHELLVLYQNEMTILKPALMPLQFINVQQSFIDWSPNGGILLSNAIILYGAHSIFFYNRSTLIQKSWQIDIVQDIECIKSTPKGQCLGMKVKNPDNSIFLWNTKDPSIKPAQEIVLTQSIIQWEFCNSDILTILTTQELRIYRRDANTNQYNLYHFYQLTFKTFSWVSLPQSTPNNRQSISTILLLGRQGQCSVIQLLDIEKRTSKSQMKQVGKFKLQYKEINMRRIVGAWGQQGKFGLACQTKNKALFCFVITSSLKVELQIANEDLLGAEINAVACLKSTILARDRTRWKLFQFTNNSIKMTDQVDCEKALIVDQNTMICFDKQNFFIRSHSKNSEPTAFKYNDAERIHYIGNSSGFVYFALGIRFYRWSEAGLSACGVALRNERAVLVEVNVFTRTILYRINDQFILLSYRIQSQKVNAGSLKSSSTFSCSLTGGLWVQKYQQEIKVGSGEKVLTVFPINKLLKILDCENQNYEYNISPIYGNGLIIQIKNYVFFLQLVQDERGYELVLLKRSNTLIYRRFNPQANIIKLVQASALIFWVGNQIIRFGSRLDSNICVDPFALSQTLLAKQLDLRKIYPPHHPKLLIVLIESNRFQLLLQVLHKIYSWFESGEGISELYKCLSIDFIADCDELSKQGSISLFAQQRLQEQVNFLKTFSEQILNNPDKIQLKEKNPLIFESILSALAYLLTNAKSYDYFSQSILLLQKTPQRPRSFNSMQIALLSHSLNKAQALSELRKDKGQINWEWIKNLALPFWYDNKEQLRKLVEEVAANEYRSKKEPFDSLFWYLLVGKRSLITTLFKNHRLNSKEHQATCNFLGRDFNQAKDRSAAIKNAYVLIDKKRYFHAMSFFILGGAIDDCIRLCVDRLNDLSLAYTFVLFFKEANPAYLFSEMKKGDVWMKHLVCKIESHHILSYNSLFETEQCNNWNYSPQLSSFHPILPQFALKIRNSIGVKRQIDQQSYKNNASQDIFADFYEDSTSQSVQQETPKVSLQGDPDSFKDEVQRYYIRQGLSVLALAQNRSLKQALQIYAFQKYKLSGLVDPSMQQTITNLQDKVGLVQCLLANNQISDVSNLLKKMPEEISSAIAGVNLQMVVRNRKSFLGQLMRLGYQSQMILKLLKQKATKQASDTLIQEIKNLRLYTAVTKIISALILQDYQYLPQLLQGIKSKPEEPQEPFWPKLKELYDKLSQVRKEKSVKQMDHFQHAFIGARRKVQEQQSSRTELAITKEQAAILLLRLLVLNYLLKTNIGLKKQLQFFYKQISYYLNHWISADIYHDIVYEFKILIKQGSQSKLKLNLLKTLFDQQFTSVYDIVACTHNGYFQESNYVGASLNQGKQLQGIEVFRNRQDGLRSFTINQYDSRGVQCIVMFKRGLKKFQVCQNLANRQRNKDGLGLVVEDTFYTSLSNTDPHSIDKGKFNVNIQKALTHILQSKKQSQFPRNCTPMSGKDYLRQIQPPYLDYNQLNSIQCHPHLPFFLIGGKSNVELAHLSTLKNFDRIKCPQVGQIVRLHSCGQRVGVADSAGNLGLHLFDTKYVNSCVFSLKKTATIDFCFLRPSVLAVLNSTGVQVYDTLLHPKRQLKFKQPFTKDPISVSAVDQTHLAVLRKNEVLIYDIRMQKLQGSRQLKGKGKSMLVQGKSIYVGQSDCKVKVFSTVGEQSQSIKLSVLDEKDREKIGVQELHCLNDIILASTSEGSIFYLPKLK